MKHVFLFLFTTLYLFAAQEKKIILATFFNEKEAVKGLQKAKTAFDSDFYALQKKHNFKIALFSSRDHYILALNPFKNLAAAGKILPHAKRAYSSAFISNHSKKANQLISTVSVDAPPKEKTSKKENPIVLQAEFLKPITVNEILKSSKPKEIKKSKSEPEVSHLKTTPSMSGIFYFFYGLLTILIIALLVMILKNSGLKRRIKERDKILKAHLNPIAKDIILNKTSSITSIKVAEYIDDALKNELNSISKIQNLIEDILNVDSLLHGKAYVNNREFQLSEITHAVAKRHNIFFNVNTDIPKTLIGDIDIIKRIFLRFSYMSLGTVSINATVHNEDQIELEFALQNICEENNSIDTTLIVQLIDFIDGKVSIIKEDNNTEKYIKSFKLPFTLVQDSTFRVKRP